MAQGASAGIFVFAEDEDLVEQIHVIAQKHKILIQDITAQLGQFEDKTDKVYYRFREVMENGGFVIAHPPEDAEAFFMTRIGTQFLEYFARATFARPSEDRLPVFLNLQSHFDHCSESLIRLMMLSRSYRVGACLVTRALRQLDDTALKRNLLSNIFGYTAFHLQDPIDREDIGRILSLEPHLLDRTGIEKGCAYCRYVNPSSGVRDMVIVHGQVSVAAH